MMQIKMKIMNNNKIIMKVKSQTMLKRIKMKQKRKNIGLVIGHICISIFTLLTSMVVNTIL